LASDEDEDTQLRIAALRNAEEILLARQRAEQALRGANEALEQKNAELQEQREWFRVTLSSIGDAVITTDLHGNVTFLNPVAEQLTGWTSAEAQGRRLNEIFNIINENTRQGVEHPVDRVLREGRVVGLANHTALISRHGTITAIEDSAAPIRDAHGRLAGAVMVFHDVTERRQTEAALNASENRFRAIFSQAAVGIALTDLQGRFLQVNARLAEISGYSVEELKDRSVLQVTHPHEITATEDAMRRLLAEEIPQFALQKRWVRKDGTTVWTLSTVTLIRDSAGQPLHFVGIVEDITERRRADEAMARLAAVIASSDDAILSMTLDAEILSWNSSAERMFGYTKSEMIGQSPNILIPPERAEEESAILEQIRAGGRIEHFHTVRRRKDGAMLDVSIAVSPINDAHGHVIGASKITRDITHRKRAEEALQEETRILEILNRTGAAIASQLDLESLVQTVTDSATQLSGAKFGAFFYNVSNDKGESFLLFSLSGASREAFEKFGMPRNTPIFGPTFRAARVVRSADVTQDENYGLMAPHHGMPKGHLPVRSYLAVPVVSRSGEVIGGLFFGHPDVNVFSERSERLIVGIAGQAAVAIDNARLYEAAQREIAIRERAEATLRETDRRKDEFLATLAHELRNPLAPIRQAALISKTPGASDAQKRWSHDVITRQVHHMSLLLDDLLDISRVTRGTLELRLETTDLNDVIEAAIETARPTIDAKRHELRVEKPQESLQIVADPLRLAQILSNLLTNAAKYTDPQGQIVLKVECAADHITLSVKDTGIGIPPDAIADVFEMFAQVRSSQDRSEGGLGIGLALSKGLVELHGGHIEARSAGAGQGSEFTVRLPRRVLPVAVASAVNLPAKETCVRRRILIADDNRDAAQSLAMLLELEGHDVRVVHDGHAAVEAFGEFRPEVVLLDIGMPGLDGYEVARAVRQDSLGRAVKLVALTGWGQDRDKARALAAGFNHHFTKPVEPGRISELLRSIGRS
jgi:PAS domain S-box-containing protein